MRAKEVDCLALPLSMTLNHQILLACNVSIVHLKPPPKIQILAKNQLIEWYTRSLNDVFLSDLSASAGVQIVSL